VVTTLDGWDAQGLKAVAASIASRGRAAAILLGTSAPMAVVIARSPDVALDANAVLQQLLARFGGRGGGKADLAQGAGLTGDPKEIIAAARELLT
jgi:alanyl-tRNA synthetase